MLVVMNPSTPLDLISEREQTAAQMRRDLEVYEATTEGMRLMLAAVRPRPSPTPQRPMATGNGAPASAAIPVRSPSGGRPPGAISQNWRGVLYHLHGAYKKPGRGFSPDGLAKCAVAFGLPNLRPKDAKNRIANYIDHGYIERGDMDDYFVTDYAIDRFRAWGPIKPFEAPASEPTEASHSLGT
jgi:hypothetical protein